MARKQGSVTLGLGMLRVPMGVTKASQSDRPELKSLCDCGGRVGALSNDEGHKVQCKDNPAHTFPWYNSVPGKGVEIAGEVHPIDPEAIEEARKAQNAETGEIERVVPVKQALLQYAVTGNYYLLPEDGHREQYGALLGALNQQDWAILTYIQLRSKTSRFAIVAEGGVLLALRLADKKALPELHYGHNEEMEAQAIQMLEPKVTDDAAIPDVEAEALQAAVRGSITYDDEEAEEATEKVAAEV